MPGTYAKADFHAGAEVFGTAIVPHPPIAPTEAASKQYVDDSAEVTIDPAEPMTIRTDLWIDVDENYPPTSTVDSLDDLVDVDTATTAPVVGDMLMWDGLTWVPSAPWRPLTYDDLATP